MVLSSTPLGGTHGTENLQGRIRAGIRDQTRRCLPAGFRQVTLDESSAEAERHVAACEACVPGFLSGWKASREERWTLTSRSGGSIGLVWTSVRAGESGDTLPNGTSKLAAGADMEKNGPFESSVAADAELNGPFTSTADPD